MFGAHVCRLIDHCCAPPTGTEISTARAPNVGVGASSDRLRLPNSDLPHEKAFRIERGPHIFFCPRRLGS